MALADGEWRMGSRSKGKSMAAIPRSRSSSAGKAQRAGGSLDRQRARTSVMNPLGAAKVDFKAEKQKNIQELLQCLSDFGCQDKAFSTKDMQCPTTTAFLSIYSSLMELLIDQPFKLLGKPEDEIPGQMKILGYPYQVSKSMIVSIAPHTWPQLLYALVWLCQQIKAIMAEPIVCEKSDYFMEQCNIFKGGKETDMNDMLSKVRSMNDPMKQQLEQQLEQFDKAQLVLEQNETKCSYWAQEKERHEVKITNLKKYIDEMKRYMENFELRLADLQNKVTSAEKLQAEKQLQLEQCEERFSRENPSPEEVERIKKEVEDLCDESSRLCKETEEADKRKCRTEIEVSRLRDELSKQIKEANGLLTKWPAEDGSITSISLSSTIPIMTQYVYTIKPMVEYYHSKLHDPDQMHDINRRLEERIAERQRELAQLKEELVQRKEGLIRFHETKADELESRHEKQEKTIQKWNAFQLDFYTRKRRQLLELQRQKRELDTLKRDAAFSLRILNYIQTDKKILELESERASWIQQVGSSPNNA